MFVKYDRKIRTRSKDNKVAANKMADSWSCSVFVRLPIRTLLPTVTSHEPERGVFFSSPDGVSRGFQHL